MLSMAFNSRHQLSSLLIRILIFLIQNAVISKCTRSGSIFDSSITPTNKEIYRHYRYPISFPGYLFVPLSSIKHGIPYKASSKPELSSTKVNGGFEGLDEEEVSNFITEFLEDRFLDLMKEEIVSYYSKDHLEGRTASFLPFDVESITNYDIKLGLVHNKNKKYRTCDSCAPGYPGPVGKRGFTGDRGLLGDKGNIGPKGNKGLIGLKGIKGTKADKGDGGQKGMKGPKAEMGPPGMKGITGTKGVVGIPGMNNRGPPGSDTPGPTGPKGGATYCCDPGLYDLNLGKCLIYIPIRLPFNSAQAFCAGTFAGGSILPITAANYMDVNSVTDFLDGAGTHIWSSFGSGFTCNIFDTTSNTVASFPCVNIDDFVCQYNSICGIVTG